MQCVMGMTIFLTCCFSQLRTIFHTPFNFSLNCLIIKKIYSLYRYVDALHFAFNNFMIWVQGNEKLSIDIVIK